jgi:hypothetical protein
VHVVIEDHGADEGSNQPEPAYQEERRESSAMVAEELLGLVDRRATSFQKSVHGSERLSEVSGETDLKGVAPG